MLKGLAEQRNRRSRRVAVRAPVMVGGYGYMMVSLLMVDLSTVGFRIKSHTLMRKGVDVFARVGTVLQANASVVWSDGEHIGFVFQSPINDDLVERVAALYPHR